MIPRTKVPAGLTQLAMSQSGALSREQVRAFGLTDRVVARLVEQDAWRRLASGIYALTTQSWLQLAWAGVLIGGGRAVLGGRAAAHLHGIAREPPDRILVFVGSAGRVARNDDRWQFVRADRSGPGEPPRTRLPQTVIDLCAGLDPDEITALVADVVAARRARPEDLIRVVHATHRIPHRRLLLDILGDVADGVDSPLERRYLHDVERAHGLPKASRRVRPAARFLTDAWYRAYGVVVELDGDRYHRGLARTGDMTRDNVHRLSGLITLRYSWAHVVGDPCEVARQVSIALRAGGWSGTPETCRRCRAEHRAP